MAAVTCGIAPATSHQPAGDQGRGHCPASAPGIWALLIGIISTSVRSGTVRQGF